jgi:hypothetical protein
VPWKGKERATTIAEIQNWTVDTEVYLFQNVVNNPGRVAKGQIGGSYARMVINVNDLKSQSSILQHTAAQVLRVWKKTE